MSDDDLSQTIKETAATAKKAKGDNGELEQHNLSELITADRYLKEQEAARNPTKTLRFSRVVPPGSV